MSVASRIRGAVQNTEIPCYQNEYTGNSDRYFVFTIGTQPLLYADDVPWAERYLCQLHLHLPNTENSTALQASIKNAITNAGFTFPETENVGDETGQHIVFMFEDTEGLVWQD